MFEALQKEIAAYLDILYKRVNHIINKELNFRKFYAQWVLQMLTEEMKKKS